jgi:hypothetical protein
MSTKSDMGAAIVILAAFEAIYLLFTDWYRAIIISPIFVLALAFFTVHREAMRHCKELFLGLPLVFVFFIFFFGAMRFGIDDIKSTAGRFILFFYTFTWILAIAYTASFITK